MASMSRGLGKGLDALLNSSASEPDDALAASAANTTDVQLLDLTQIKPNPQQPRRTFTEESLEELAQSITEQGVLQPILVRPVADGYQIVAGERRWRASRLAGLEQVPALVRSLSDKESLVLALLENLQREDLNPLEEAQALERLQGEMGVSQSELAKHVCKSRSAVANSLRLLQLDEEIRQAVLDGSLSAGNARTLMGVNDAAARMDLFEIVLMHELTVRQTEKIVSYWKEHGQFPAPYGGKSQHRAPAADQRDRFLHDLQQVLKDHLPAKIQLRGGREKGKISMHYDSPEQLEQILSMLGVPAEGVSRETPSA